MVLRGDAIAGCYLALVVHIYFCERDTAGLGLLRGELLENGRYDFTWAAPIRVEVYYEVRGRLEKLGKVLRGGDADYF